MKQFIIICVLVFSFLECYSQTPEDTVYWEMEYDPPTWRLVFPSEPYNIRKIDDIYFMPSYTEIVNYDPKLYLFEFDETGDYLRLVETDIPGYPTNIAIEDDRIKIITYAYRAKKRTMAIFSKDYKLLDTMDLAVYNNENSDHEYFFFNIDNILSFISWKSAHLEQFMNITDESGNLTDRFELLFDGESMPSYMYIDNFHDFHQSENEFAFNFMIKRDSKNKDKGYFRRIVNYDENYNYISHKDFGYSAEYFKTDIIGPNANDEMLVIYDLDNVQSQSNKIKFELINSDFEIISEAEFSYGHLRDYNYQLLSDGSFIFYYNEQSDIENDDILSQIQKFSQDGQIEWEFNNYLIHHYPSEGDTRVQILDDLLIMHGQILEPDPEASFNATYIIRAYRLTSTSVHDSPIFDSSLLYPNPYSNGGRLSVKSDNLTLPGNAEIYDLSGRLIATVYAISRGDTSYDLKMPPLFAGSFVLKLNFSGSFESYPFVVE